VCHREAVPDEYPSMKLFRILLLLVAAGAGASALVGAVLFFVLRLESKSTLAPGLLSGIGYTTVVLILVAAVAFGVRALLAARQTQATAPRFATRVVKIGGYLLFLLVLTEGVARFVYRVPAFADRLWANESNSWRRMWVMRQVGGAPPLFAFDVFDQLRGWVTRPGIVDAKVFDDKTLNTNAFGMRGAREFARERAPGRTRVVVLGDSFTFGEEVSDHEVYVDLLNQRFPNAEFLNLGVHGYAHDQMSIHFDELGASFAPDIVLLGFVQVDIDRNRLEFRDYAKPRFELDGDGLALVGSPVPAPEDLLRFEFLRPRVADLVATLQYRVAFSKGWLESEENELTARILDRIAESALRVGATPLFAHLPTGFEIAADSGKARAEVLIENYARSRAQVRCFSTRALFQERRRSGEIQDVEGHWDAAGHRAAAAAIAAYLTREKLLEG
jgi:hypothetical protein